MEPLGLGRRGELSLPAAFPGPRQESSTHPFSRTPCRAFIAGSTAHPREPWRRGSPGARCSQGPALPLARSPPRPTTSRPCIGACPRDALDRPAADAVAAEGGCRAQHMNLTVDIHEGPGIRRVDCHVIVPGRARRAQLAAVDALDGERTPSSDRGAPTPLVGRGLEISPRSGVSAGVCTTSAGALAPRVAPGARCSQSSGPPRGTWRSMFTRVRASPRHLALDVHKSQGLPAAPGARCSQSSGPPRGTWRSMSQESGPPRGTWRSMSQESGPPRGTWRSMFTRVRASPRHLALDVHKSQGLAF